MLRKLLVLLLLVTLAIAAGAYLLSPPRPPRPLPYNVLWLTAESLRPAHLSCYGYDKPTSPNIDAFAKRGTLFKWCINPSGWTNENMVSNLSGLYSPVHGVISRDRHVPPEWYLPMEILRDAGLRTPRMQGFQGDLNHAYLGYDEEANNLDPSDWLEQHKDQQFFMWFHILESHLPYDAPEPHRGLFWRDELVPNEAARKRVMAVHDNGVILAGSIPFNREEDLPGIRALYDADVHYMDSKFGRIMETLDRLGLREKTLVIFSADHGEELLERGNVGHASTAKGGTLYDEIIHVPLIISMPGRLPEGLVIDAQVRGVDVMPTVFDVLGLPAEKYFQGESLVPMMEDPAWRLDRVAYASSSFKGYQEDDPDHVVDFTRVVRTPEWKLYHQIRGGTDETYQLFHLADDAGETRDVGGEHPDKLAEMRRRLADWLAECKARRPRAEPYPSLWAAVRDQLGLRRAVDLSGVASPPLILSPTNGALLSWETTRGEVEITWTGKPGIPYFLQAEIGQGPYHFTLSIPVEGPRFRRSFEEGYWNEYVHRYNPIRFRVKVDAPGHEWSAWTQVRVE
ncbi:sulfatase-like hydrolase/transferase [bacterium]|nr:sulfatase-like hydrolase/transferase [bacterium]